MITRESEGISGPVKLVGVSFYSQVMKDMGGQEWMTVSNTWVPPTLFLPLPDFGFKGLFAPVWEHTSHQSYTDKDCGIYYINENVSLTSHLC